MDDLTRIRNGLDEAHTELRELLNSFRAPLDRRGLVPALEQLTEQLARETGMHVFFQKDCRAPSLSAAVEMQLLRIVQEALTNVRKHSKAQTVRVLLSCRPGGAYMLLVEDAFDISIIEIGDGVFEVRSTNGDTHLGGDDFDQRVIDWLADEFKKLEGIDLRKDPMALHRLTEAAEKAKCELSGTMETDVNLPFITADQNGPKHLNIKLSRAKLEQLVEELIERCRRPVLQALKDAGLTPQQIMDILMRTSESSSCGGFQSAPLIDAYAAVLALDWEYPDAEVQRAILDLNDDRFFNEMDVEQFLAAFEAANGAKDYSRYDLLGPSIPSCGCRR